MTYGEDTEGSGKHCAEMPSSPGLQALATETIQDLELLVTALNAAPEENQLDYDKLLAHVCAATRILETIRIRMLVLEKALG